jgi:hypothetical protein
MTKFPIDYAKDILKKKIHLGDECEMSVKITRLNNCKTIAEIVLWCEYWLEFPYGENPKNFIHKVIEQGTKAWD